LLIYPITNFKKTEQLNLVRGEGVYVYDNEGKQYLEGMAGLWCTALGYGNQELIDASSEQMGQLSYSHMFSGKTHPIGMELSEKLAAMLPVESAKISFGNSGSDANDTLIKLLRYYFDAIGKPEKYKIIARDRAYHGVTVASASLTGLAVNHTHFHLPFDALGVLRADAPHYYHGALPSESEDDFVDRITNNLEKMILKEGAETIAAFIAEPITGASGVIVPPEGYYEKNAMIENTDKAGVFGHGYTYSGHPVASAVALKTLEIYERDEIFAKATILGEYMQKKLQTFKDHPLVGEVRGKGLIGAIEIVANKEHQEAFKDGSVGGFAVQACQDEGLIIRAVAGSSLAFCPPLIITEAQIDEIFDKFGRALEATLAYVNQRNLRVA